MRRRFRGHFWRPLNRRWAPRKHTPPEVELSVLERSRRRCALCFHLNADLKEKHGQIAHLDNDRANYAEENLAFLCMEHHSLYDSRTSQHKNYAVQEVKSARTMLYEAIVQGKHRSVPPPAAVISAKLYDLKISALQELWQALTAAAYVLKNIPATVGPQWGQSYTYDSFSAT